MHGANADKMKTRLRSLKVLVVDDNSWMRRIVRDLLSNFGIRHIIEGADGVEALKKVHESAPDLMILDWEMPFLNGFEVVRIIRKPGVFPFCDLPIIMLSAYGERSQVLEAMRIGVNEFVKKPVSATALFQRIVAVELKPRAMVNIDGYYRPAPRVEPPQAGVTVRRSAEWTIL